MNQTVIILVLILLIIIALNYKNISYDKVYKKGLKLVKEYISEKMEKKKRKHKKRKSKKIANKNEQDENLNEEDGDDGDDFTLSKIIDNGNNDEGSFLSDMSTLDINTIESENSIGTSLSFS